MSLLSRIRNSFGHKRLAQELDEELRSHIEMRTRENIAAGMTSAAAHEDAQRRFGNRTLAKEETRSMDIVGWLETSAQDARFGLRTLRKSPGFAAVTILTLALGIGANTALFSALEALTFRPLPYPNVYRVMHLYARWPGGFGNMSYPDYQAIRERNKTFESVAICESWGTVAETGVERPVQLRTTFVSPNYLEILGAKTVAGRLFRAEDNTSEGANAVVILNFGTWQMHFGGDPSIVGRVIELNRTPYTVIGVMSAEFHGLGEVEEPPPDIYLPITMAHALLGQPPQSDPGYSIYWGLGLLKPGATIGQAQEDLSLISKQIERDLPNIRRGHDLVAQSAADYSGGHLHRPLYILIGGAGLILLIGCVNIANSLVARLVLRRREIAVRRALGASVPRLARQLLVECGLLAFAGGAAGVLLAYWLMAILERRIHEHVNPFVAININGWVLLGAFTLCVGTTLCLALLPVLDVRRVKIAEMAGEGGRAGMSAGMRAIRRGLVIAEVSFSVVLLIGAGLMLRSLENLVSSGVGFRTDHLLTFSLGLRGTKYADPAKRTQFADALVEKGGARPGIESVSIFGPAMLGHATWVMSVYPSERQPRGPEDFVQTFRHSINPGALSNLEIPLIGGREFNRFDTPEAPPVVIISQTIAREFWPNENALGKQLKRPDPTLPLLNVVGVAADVRHRDRYSLQDLQFGLPLGGLGPQRDLYFPYAQRPNADVTVAVRTKSDIRAASEAIVGVVAGIDGDLPVNDMRLLDDRLADQSQAPAALGTLMGIYAFLALFMASLGIYSVMSQTLSQRTKEIGIRVALGAQQGGILKMVVGEGLRLIVVGIVLGLGGAWGLTRLMASFLYGVGAKDPITFASVVPVLAIVAVVACLIPARRAAKMDPVVALRHD